MKKTSRLLTALAALCLAITACKRAPERTPKLYRSPMHPWITSDKPGNCTICGMQLVPEYEDAQPSTPSASAAITLADASRAVMGIATSPVERGTIHGTLKLSGILEDDDTLHRSIAAFYEGRIEKVYVQQVGQKVSAGQPLAAIYSPELLYVVREYQNASKRGKSDPIAANARLRLIQYGLAPAQVDALANSPRENYTIDVLSPADGTILSRSAWEGAYVKNGEPLFELGNFARLWFKAEVYERDLPLLRIGQKATVTSPAAPGRDLEGTVTFIDPNFDPVTRSTKVRIEVPNPPSETPGGLDRLLPHRAYAEAIVTTEIPDVLSIPRSALLRDGRREIVFVESAPGTFTAREVRAGDVTADRAVIREGLTAGENVVTSGHLLLDAEVQLRGGAPAGNQLPATQLAFFEQIGAVSAALARDDLSAAARAAEHLHAPQGLSGKPPTETMNTTNLETARRTFLPWATYAAEALLAANKAGFFGPVSVVECPMTGSAFEGAPKEARWVQHKGPVTNPYLGSRMPDCGTEVSHE